VGYTQPLSADIQNNNFVQNVVQESKHDHGQHIIEAEQALVKFACEAAQQGLKLLGDTPADGNCFFWAVSSQLSRVNQIHQSHYELRTAVTNFLKNLPQVNIHCICIFECKTFP